MFETSAISRREKNSPLVHSYNFREISIPKSIAAKDALKIAPKIASDGS